MTIKITIDSSTPRGALAYVSGYLHAAAVHSGGLTAAQCEKLDAAIREWIELDTPRFIESARKTGGER